MLFGLAEIGLEIENPWGHDKNDLDTDQYASHIALELETLTGNPPPEPSSWFFHHENKPLFPMNNMNPEQLAQFSTDQFQEMLQGKGRWLASRAARSTKPVKSTSRHSVTSLRRDKGPRSLFRGTSIRSRDTSDRPQNGSSDYTGLSTAHTEHGRDLV